VLRVARRIYRAIDARTDKGLSRFLGRAPEPARVEAIRWAYRLLLDREPESETVRRRFSSNAELCRGLLLSEEFRKLNPDLVFGFPIWVITQTHHGFRLWVSLEEQAISRHILQGDYEEAEAAFVRRIVRPGDHVIDAGANIGFFTMLLAQAVTERGSVRAFEPLPFLFEALERSVRENRFETIVGCERIALSDADGTGLFRYAPKTANFGGGHLAEPGVTPAAHIDELVEMRRLDAYLDERRVAFIKVDVEGAEPRVISGALTMLARDRPRILSELHNAQLHAVSGVSASDFLEQMSRLDYRCFAIERDGRGRHLTTYDKATPINVIFEPAGDQPG